jgi:ABC-type sugar transport system ATPase subunit
MTVTAGPPLAMNLSGIRKSFGETQALRGLDLQVRAGEILGVAGPNGAGKSTLVRILAGEDQRDDGEIRVDGRSWEPGDPADPVAVVHQEAQVWTNLSLRDNLLVGRESYRVGRPRLSDVEFRILEELDVASLVDRPLADCSLAVRQRAEIARAIARKARFFLFDEPNSALTEEQSDQLFAYMHDLAFKGTIVMLVSHRLAELVVHCDRVVVIRDGQVTAEFGGAELTQEAIARELVVGAVVSSVEGGTRATSAPSETATLPAAGLATTAAAGSAPVLKLRGWSHPRELFLDIDLEVARGEILAAVGVEGSGARELVASIAGFGPGTGTRSIGGAQGANAVEEGSVYLPADRRLMLFRNLSVGENLVARLGVPEIAALGGILRPRRLRAVAARVVRRFGIRTASPEAPLPSLSGGNQQKVAIAGAIVRDPAILALEEPTRGVDVGAKRDIYGILREYTSAGGAVFVYCTEVPEVFELADRAIVIDRGRVVREIRVADYADVATLAADIARSEKTAITQADLAASHATMTETGSSQG